MKIELNPADYIQPLNMNGLAGRMLHMPAPKNKSRELLVIYGHHALLERWWGLMLNFNDFGAVTMPDLPGFGGMDSFYTIGRKPTLDNYADYMAAFVKMHYKHRRVTIVGISFGFLIATRMLQRYPELTKKVDVLISAVGFMHKSDFTFNKTRMLLYRRMAGLIATPPAPLIFRYSALNPRLLKLVYAKTFNAKHKFAEAADDPELFNSLMDMEVKLWHSNDVKTHMRTTVEMLTVDNIKKPIDLVVWHVSSKNDHYFNNQIVEQHMRAVFKDYIGAPINLKTHAPSVMADKKSAAIMIPPKLRRLLNKSTQK
ncbi:MAG: alpha/beta fold hydrolase [Candidatus Saccharimonadales bacterium]